MFSHGVRNLLISGFFKSQAIFEFRVEVIKSHGAERTVAVKA